jgi:hypothetical protein
MKIKRLFVKDKSELFVGNKLYCHTNCYKNPYFKPKIRQQKGDGHHTKIAYGEFILNKGPLFTEGKYYTILEISPSNICHKKTHIWFYNNYGSYSHFQYNKHDNWFCTIQKLRQDSL